MIRKICVVSLLSCSIAWGQSFVTAKAAGVPGFDPNAAYAITAKGSLPQFDAVTIKPAVTRDQQSNSVYAYPGGRIFCAHCTLQFLTTLAFNLPDWQITGSTELDARYDIDATAAQGSQSTAWNSRTPLTEEQRQMLKSLLIERFGLKGHRETRLDTVYLLQRGDHPLNCCRLCIRTNPPGQEASVEAPSSAAPA